MSEIVVGVVLVAVGLLLCFRGYAALRIAIAAWGAVVGFSVGAGAVAVATGQTVLASPLAWLAGGAVAVAFGIVAYAFYAVSVVIGMGGIGFTLGTTAMVAIGVSWSWLIAAAGLGLAVALAVLAIVKDLPMVVLAVLGAFAGASAALAGLFILTGDLTIGALGQARTTGVLAPAGGWWIAYLALAAAGIIVQLRERAARSGSLRAAWG